MKNKKSLKLKILIVVIIILILSANCSKNKIKPKKPNVIYILADDLGYAELGCYGQEKIKTPNIDKLAEDGIKFTNHYSGSAVSAPSRCSLLSGMHQGHAYIRGNAEVGEWYDYTGQEPIPDSLFTIAELFKQQGYKTAAIGKWGLGNFGEGHPNNQGFDYFYGYLCQRQAHNYFPTYLWENTTRDSLRNKDFKPHYKLTSGITEPDNYKRFLGNEWAPEKMKEKTLEFIKKNRDNSFFLYLPTPLPHLALQIPDSIRESFNYNFQDKPYIGDKGYTPNFTPRESYAAMISYLDYYVGEVVKALKKYGLEENTLIIFSSDNGTSYVGGVDYKFFKSVGNLKGLKGELYEGGIKVPFIAKWPGHIKAGKTSDLISAFWDMFPTFEELLDTETNIRTDGISLLPELLDNKSKQQKHKFLYWEFHERDGGVQAVRIGKWKAIRKNAHNDNKSHIELYDLLSDPGESIDLSGKNPNIIRKVKSIFRAEHKPSAIKNWKFPLKR